MTRPTCPACQSTNTWRSDLTDPDATAFQHSCGDCGTDFSPAEYQELIDLVFSQTIGEIDLNDEAANARIKTLCELLTLPFPQHG